MTAECDPSDILANRLDPWHGAHYHPHAFARLRVLADEPHRLLVRVAYRVLGPLAVEVDATFHCPDPRTIVMTIVGGEGTGSVVETHATPIGPGRCAVLEATLATSERRGFALARGASRLLRPLIERRAARLWVEDVAYAERRFRLRARAPVRLRTIRGEAE
jgi:isorenieratene synthase